MLRIGCQQRVGRGPRESGSLPFGTDFLASDNLISSSLSDLKYPNGPESRPERGLHNN